MSERPILLWPETRLAQVCAPVAGADVSALVRDMFDTMYGAPGRGLAAPQIGVMQRVFVMDCGWKDGQMTPLACLDPVIVSASHEQSILEEGCLSVPGLLVPVERPCEVVLEYFDTDGGVSRAALSGFAARCAQHELDHLDGVMHFDRVDANARDRLLVHYTNQQIKGGAQ